MSAIKIAYIAPEIPSLSATFVYQEILELEKLGIKVFPVSIHHPVVRNTDDTLKKLENKTFYLYEQSGRYVLWKNISFLFKKPAKYLTTLAIALSDSIKIGLFSHAGKGLIYRFFIAVSLFSRLTKEGICHIHSNFAHIPTDIAMYASTLMGVEYSFTSHANDLFERGWLLAEKVNRSNFSVTISNFNMDFLTQKGGDKNKIKVIHCGVNTSEFTVRNTEPDNNILLLGSLGRMVEKKGFDVLIEAMLLLRESKFVCKLQLAGDGPLLSHLRKKVNDYGLDDSVYFIGSLSHNEVSAWMNSLDIFILPCKKDVHGDMDGIPVVLMEAMLTGIPVISTNISGIPELIVDGDTGFLCNQNEPECLADKIKSIKFNQKETKKICQNGINKVRGEFELRHNTEILSEYIGNAYMKYYDNNKP